MKKLFTMLLCAALIFVAGASFYVCADDEDMTVDMTMVAGASIRLNNGSAIRFYTIVDTEHIEELRSAGYSVQLGTLIGPPDLMGSEDLSFTLNSSKYFNSVYSGDDFYSDSNGIVGITGTLNNVKDRNLGRDFLGRGYAIVSKDGKTVTSYADYANGDISNNTRSVQRVAQSIKNDSEVYDTLAENMKNNVDAWADGHPYSDNS